MTSLTLVVLDTTGIQEYIFGSNRLRENVGASHLVHQASSGWLMENPGTLLPTRHNIRGGKRKDDVGQIENNTLDVELLYAGGGNTVLLFREAEDAGEFAGKLSRKLLQEAPGLEAVLVSQAVDWDGSLASAMQEVTRKLAAKKAERERSQPLLGLGVTAACQSTGLVGNYVVTEPGEEDNKLVISAEVRAKWNQNKAARVRLRKEFLPEGKQGPDFPDQFDHLGRTEGEQSYIAVVHADGNSMGRTLEKITENARGLTGADNRKYIRWLREFSDAANEAGSEALKTVVSKVGGWMASGEIEPSVVNGKEYLPIRPLVYGGDDVAYVCDGRIGLKTAQVFLEAFHQYKIPDGEGGKKPGLAAAGVAIVKVRYPFARAYQLAEQLCKNAKNWCERDRLALDWHLAQSGLFGRLEHIREREYMIWEDGNTQVSLLMRPVTVGEPRTPTDWHRWCNFVHLLRTFKSQWPRNKVMSLRQALREGSQAVRAFTTNYGKLPRVDGTAANSPETGQDKDQCVYFDAIEMIEQEAPA